MESYHSACQLKHKYVFSFIYEDDHVERKTLCVWQLVSTKQICDEISDIHALRWCDSRSHLICSRHLYLSSICLLSTLGRKDGGNTNKTLLWGVVTGRRRWKEHTGGKDERKWCAWWALNGRPVGQTLSRLSAKGGEGAEGDENDCAEDEEETEHEGTGKNKKDDDRCQNTIILWQPRFGASQVSAYSS